MIQQCQEVEELERHHKVKEMHNRAKRLSTLKSKKWNSGFIERKDGRILFEQQDTADRQAEYIAELYDDERQPLSQNMLLLEMQSLTQKLRQQLR